MSERQKIIFLSSVLWLFLAAPWLFLYWKEANWINSKHLELSWNLEGPFRSISKENSPICQYFMAPADDLKRIDLMLSRGDGLYHFELRGLDTNKELSIDRKNNLAGDGRLVKDGQFVTLYSHDSKNKAQNYDFMSFVFEPIEDSGGRSLAFCLSSELDNNSESGVFLAVQKYEGHALVAGDDFYEGGNLVYQVYSYDKSLGFREFFDVLFTRMSQYKPEFLKVPYLYIIWLLFYSFLFGVIYKLIRMGRK